MFHQITLLYYNISIYLYRSFPPALITFFYLGPNVGIRVRDLCEVLHVGSDAWALNLKHRLISARECHFGIILIKQPNCLCITAKKLRFQRYFALSWLKDDHVNILHSIFSVQLVPNIAYILSYFFFDERDEIFQICFTWLAFNEKSRIRPSSLLIYYIDHYSWSS